MIKVKYIINAKLLLVQKWVLVLASLIMGSISNKKKLTAVLIAVVLLAATSNVGMVYAQNADDFAEQCASLFKQGRYEESLLYCDKALEIDPNHVLALGNKGVALGNLGRYEEAISYFDKALEIDPNNADALYNKGFALYNLGRYKEAISYFDKALEIDPNYANALKNKNEALRNLGREPEIKEQRDGTSGCLIATAAFGSELSPQVQFLRDYRDQKIMNTLAGSSFMQVFNAWYYSFSPYVADYERGQPWLQHTVKTSIYPLIGILQTSEKANSSIDGEYGAVVAGLIASSMIGALYFWPFAISIRRVRTSRFNYKLALSMIAVVFVGIIASLAAGNEYALMASTSLFVLTLVSISAVLSAKLILAACDKARNMIAKGDVRARV